MAFMTREGGGLFPPSLILIQIICIMNHFHYTDMRLDVFKEIKACFLVATEHGKEDNFFFFFF